MKANLNPITAPTRQLDHATGAMRPAREQRIIDRLQQIVADGAAARAKLTEKLTGPNAVGELAHQISWGCGVGDDLDACEAAKLLHAAETVKTLTLPDLLRSVADEYRRALLTNRFLPRSTSAFSNAVKMEKAESTRRMLDAIESWLDRLAAEA
jgi:hypothetical protein